MFGNLGFSILSTVKLMLFDVAFDIGICCIALPYQCTVFHPGIGIPMFLFLIFTFKNSIYDSVDENCEIRGHRVRIFDLDHQKVRK